MKQITHTNKHTHTHTYPAKQCAAVTTQELSTSTPPHISAPSSCRLTSQGQLPGGAGDPPTILERGWVALGTAVSLWPHTAAGREECSGQGQSSRGESESFVQHWLHCGIHLAYTLL